MRAIAVVLAVLVSGCVGVGVGGAAGVSRSTRGHTRIGVDVPAGMHTRFYSHTEPDDVGRLMFLGLVPRVTYGEASDLGGGIQLGTGGDYFRGRWGLQVLVAFGGMFDRGAMRLSFRLQAGVARELGDSEWRVDEKPPCGGASHSFVARQRRHTLLGLLPGVEYLSEDGDLPGEWVFSLAASLQRVYEPPC